MTVILTRGSDLIGRAVVDASTGDDLEEIKDVVFAASRGSITGFTLRVRKFFGRRLTSALPRTVTDVVILGGSAPRVVGFGVGGGGVGSGLIPLGAQSAVSGSTLIVPDDVEQRIRNDLTGLAAELSLIETAGS